MSRDQLEVERSNLAHELHVGSNIGNRVSVDFDEQVAARVDAEEGSADGFFGEGEFNLTRASPVAIDVVGQRGEAVFGDASVQHAQGGENFEKEVVRCGVTGQLGGEGGGDGGEGGIVSGGFVGDVESQTDDDMLGGIFLHENATDFFWSDEHIVGPAKAGAVKAQAVKCGNDGETGGEGKGLPSACGRFEGEHDGHPKSARVGSPRASVASASAGLGGSADGVPGGKMAGVVIGGGDLVGLVQCPTAPLTRGDVGHITSRAWRCSSRR